MPSSLIVLYAHPDDPAAFDRHYAEVHAPIALRLPGLSSFTGTKPGPGPDGAPAPYYFTAVLTWPDEQTMQAALASEEGKAATGDLRNFAGAGATTLLGPTEVYR